MDRRAHQLTMTVLMTRDMADRAGNVHGGTILKFLDWVAYACASGYADDERKPVGVQPLVPGTPNEQRRFSAAEVRRQLRQEFGKRFDAVKGTPAP